MKLLISALLLVSTFAFAKEDPLVSYSDCVAKIPKNWRGELFRDSEGHCWGQARTLCGDDAKCASLLGLRSCETRNEHLGNNEECSKFYGPNATEKLPTPQPWPKKDDPPGARD